MSELCFHSFYNGLRKFENTRELKRDLFYCKMQNCSTFQQMRSVEDGGLDAD